MKVYEVDKDAEKIEKEGLRLDLACGNNKREGFLGIDISEDTQADIIYNLEQYPWTPCDDNSVYEIFCSHYIEHTINIKSFMEEIYRILIPKGIVTFIAPYYSSVRAMQDFTHKRFISENTFLYFNKDWIQANKLEHYNINCNFAINYIKYIYAPEWRTRAEAAKEYARKYFINVVMDIEVSLIAIK